MFASSFRRTLFAALTIGSAALAMLGGALHSARLAHAADVTPAPRAEAMSHPPIPIRFTLKQPGYVTLVIEDADGKRVRNLLSETPFPAGENTAWWDGLDDLGRDPDAAAHGLYHIPAQFVAPGAYRVRGLAHGGISLRYEFAVYNAGYPAWETADRTGGWLANHTPPSSALYVPGDGKSRQPAVLIGSYVSEGGSGLAWLDLTGRKTYGQMWLGGVWTGAPYLARDAGSQPVPDVYAYAGASWQGDKYNGNVGELRLHALTTRPAKAPGDARFGTGIDRPVLIPTVKFAQKDKAGLSGLAVYNGLLAASLPKTGQLLFVDARAGRTLGTLSLDDPRGLAFDAQGRLLALSGRRLLRFPTDANVWQAKQTKSATTGAAGEASQASVSVSLPAPAVLIAAGLEDPQGLALDASGDIYISDRGQSHQVKAFSPDGKFLRTIGHPGVPRAGLYDPEHMNNPLGITLDSSSHLWVAEEDFQPKRVSVWDAQTGKRLNAFYGPSQYGGGGTLDPRDKTRFYCTGMEFKLDWKTGTDQPRAVLFRQTPDGLPLPFRAGIPETPLYAGSRQYLTNCYTSNPTQGHSTALLWRRRPDGTAALLAAFGRANDWDVLKGEEFRSLWPQGANPMGEYGARNGANNGANQAVFLWVDANGDGRPQPGEVQIRKGFVDGITVMPDMSFVAANCDGRARRWPCLGFIHQDTPRYDLNQSETLVEGAQRGASSGGNQALADPNGWTVLTTAPRPFSNYGLGGARRGVPQWSYPSLWPGLHASHESPAPDHPGELIGTTRLLGGLVRPTGGEAGTLFAVNGNMGDIYLFTEDGLFVSQLFQDVRQGKPWAMPVAQRGMKLNDVTLHDENFWPSITRASDGSIYLVDGGRSCLVRVDGLDGVRRLPPTPLNVTTSDLQMARAWVLQTEAARQAAQGSGTLRVAMRAQPPTVDGKLDDWAGADWAIIDRRGTKAWFNSSSKPYDIQAALCVSGDRLYAAFKTGDPNLLRNTGNSLNALFKTGGALDLMIGAQRAGKEAQETKETTATGVRSRPRPGDSRLLITRVNKRVVAALYRAVVPGTKEPIAFSSPWRTITLDRVEDVSAQVTLADDGQGNFELSVPLATLGLSPTPGSAIRGDIGVLRGDGLQTVQRVYWNNKATGIVSDVPSEAELTPQLWGIWAFVSASAGHAP